MPFKFKIDTQISKIWRARASRYSERWGRSGRLFIKGDSEKTNKREEESERERKRGNFADCVSGIFAYFINNIFICALP